MSARRSIPVLMVAWVVIAACARSGPEKLFVQSQHDGDIDFGAYYAYAWVPDSAQWANPVFVENPELPGMIIAAVDRRLAEKGFELTTAARANFLVAMSASIQDVTVISTHRYQGWSHGYNRSSLNNVSTSSQMQKMTEGTLVLEIIDTKSEGVVWQSRAAGVVTRRDDIESAVDAAVGRMLENFPPPT